MEPNITIHPSDGRIEIRQNRPAIAPWLLGKRIAEALAQVPLLLPVCGQAQAIAAARAVDGAMAHAETAAASAQRETSLWREQAHAIAWRLAVDWPDLLGEPRQLAALKAVRQAPDDARLASHLRRLMGEFADVDNVEAALEMVTRGDSLPARVVRAALDLGVRQEPTTPDQLRCEQLVLKALQAFAVEPFDALDPWTPAPVEIGPLAMAREPIVHAIRDAVGAGPGTRLLAMLMDTRAVIHALEGGCEAESPVERSWPLEPGCGLGVALTARGAVFHRVIVDPQTGDTIADWRILAPTDWHFAPHGPVAISGVDLDDRALRFLAASYDPCAPCSIKSDPDSR